MKNPPMVTIIEFGYGNGNKYLGAFRQDNKQMLWVALQTGEGVDDQIVIKKYLCNNCRFSDDPKSIRLVRMRLKCPKCKSDDITFQMPEWEDRPSYIG